MNKSPLLVKSALIDRIPFMRGKTEVLYGKYFSDRRLYKNLEGTSLAETLTAYTLGSTYEIDFVFDSVEVTPSTVFSEEEWVALGLLLRAYKEVENLNLLHLYNCFFRYSGNKIYGHVVTGRTYSLYSSTQYPATITYSLLGETLGTVTLKNLNSLKPVHLVVPEVGSGVELIIDIEMSFSGNTYQQSTLVEGEYSGLSTLDLTHPSLQRDLVPEFLRIGEYSSRLVEFFSGTLITELSDPELISLTSKKLGSIGKDFKEKANSASSRLFNQDGFLGKEVQI